MYLPLRNENAEVKMRAPVCKAVKNERVRRRRKKLNQSETIKRDKVL